MRFPRRAFAPLLALLVPVLVPIGAPDAAADVSVGAKAALIESFQIPGALHPWMVRGALVGPSSRSPELIGAEVIRRHLPAAAALDLRSSRTLTGPDGLRVVVLDQHVDGIPVFGRQTRVLVEADGSAEVLTANLELARPSVMVPTVAKPAAIRVAKETAAVFGDADALLMVLPAPGAGEPRLAWAVAGGVFGLPGRPVAFIDAVTGEVLMRFDASMNARQANVYETNPVKSPTPKLVTLKTTNPTADVGLSSEKIRALNCIDKKTVKDLNFGGFALKAHICDTIATVTADAEGNYTAIKPDKDTAPEDSYSELSMYYHTERAFEFARSTGFPLAKEQPLVVLANARVPQGFNTGDLGKLSNPELPLDPYDNAQYEPKGSFISGAFGITEDVLLFGQGSKADFAYDGDVVYHEFGHFWIYQTSGLKLNPRLDAAGVSYSPGAMHEGIADVYSFFIAGDADTGEYASKNFGIKNVRSANNKEVYPTILNGEVHNDSNPWSAAVWDVYSKLSADQKLTFAKAATKAMLGLSDGSPSFTQVAQLWIAAVTKDLSKDVGDSLTKSFEARGVLPADKRIFTYVDKGIVSSAFSQGLPTGFTGTGKQALGSREAYVPGIIQITTKAPAGSTKIRVTLAGSPARGGTFAGGGGGSPLGGGGGKAFTPVLLAKSGTPIAFTFKPFATDATKVDCVVATDKKSAACEVTLEIPGTPGTPTDVYVMIGNAGDQDGYYDNIKITSEGVVPPPVDDAGPGDDAGVDDTGVTNPADGGGSSGCGCEVPVSSSTSSTTIYSTLSLGLLGLLASRRRRTSN